MDNLQYGEVRVVYEEAGGQAGQLIALQSQACQLAQASQLGDCNAGYPVAPQLSVRGK